MGFMTKNLFQYTSGDKKMTFYTKIYPIGGVYLNGDYISLIVKIYSFETTFYDLWNFDKNGNPLFIFGI